MNGKENETEKGSGIGMNEKDVIRIGIETGMSGIAIGTAIVIVIGTEIGIATNYERKIGILSEIERKTEILMRMKR